ncbi:hypothetical protein ACXYMX_14475 [Sporosarcina sp. CAU 1771]
MKLIIPKGCNNAPRKQIVLDFTVAVLMKQNDVITEYADETIVWWNIKDNTKIEGRSSLSSAWQSTDNDLIDVIEIYQVITHGKFASVNGLISLTNGSKIDFCDVYTFSSAAKSGRVMEVKSYRV